MSAAAYPREGSHSGSSWIPVLPRWVYPLTAGCAAVGAAAFLLPALASNGSDLSEVRDAPPARAATLALRGTHVQRAYGYITVVGEVANVSPRRLKNVEAIVELLDARRGVLGVETALLEIASLAPGDSSSFSVQAHDVVGLSGYRVRFRTLMGSGIPMRRESS